MTTNKQEVVAWLHSVRQDSDVITDKVRHVWGTPRGSMGAYSVPLIRLSDYEALQAENAQLLAAIRLLCNIYVVDGYHNDQLRMERLDEAVNRAIRAAKETTK